MLKCFGEHGSWKCNNAMRIVIPSREDGEGPRRRSSASALYQARTSRWVSPQHAGAISECEVPRRLRGSG